MSNHDRLSNEHMSVFPIAYLYGLFSKSFIFFHLLYDLKCHANFHFSVFVHMSVYSNMQLVIHTHIPIYIYICHSKIALIFISLY